MAWHAGEWQWGMQLNQLNGHVFHLQGVLQALPCLEMLGARFIDENCTKTAQGPAMKAGALLHRLLADAGLRCRLWVLGQSEWLPDA